ncbi:MAG TPA: hypothetical protein VII94_06290 [Candidatus Saccharimonadales bacterium]
MAKKRYYQGRGEGMARRMDNEMGHGSSLKAEKAGREGSSQRISNSERAYSNNGSYYNDGVNNNGYGRMYGNGSPYDNAGRRSNYSYDNEGMARGFDNSDPVPNTVSGLLARESYSGYKESRRMMARDGSMIREDFSAPALLPRGVIDEYWPKANNYHMGYVEDLFYGVQKQMHEDYDDLGREMKPKKY